MVLPAIQALHLGFHVDPDVGTSLGRDRDLVPGIAVFLFDLGIGRKLDHEGTLGAAIIEFAFVRIEDVAFDGLALGVRLPEALELKRGIFRELLGAMGIGHDVFLFLSALDCAKATLSNLYIRCKFPCTMQPWLEKPARNAERNSGMFV